MVVARFFFLIIITHVYCQLTALRERSGGSSDKLIGDSVSFLGWECWHVRI